MILFIKKNAEEDSVCFILLLKWEFIMRLSKRWDKLRKLFHFIIITSMLYSIQLLDHLLYVIVTHMGDDIITY